MPGFAGGSSKLGAPAHPALEPIRRAMLDALGERLPQPYQALPARILHALDAQRLWHLRGELMQALASMHGEARATAELARISDMFAGLVPTALLRSRIRCSSKP